MSATAMKRQARRRRSSRSPSGPLARERQQVTADFEIQRAAKIEPDNRERHRSPELEYAAAE